MDGALLALRAAARLLPEDRQKDALRARTRLREEIAHGRLGKARIWYAGLSLALEPLRGGESWPNVQEALGKIDRLLKEWGS